MEGQLERDGKIIGLVTAMRDAYTLIDAIEEIPEKIQALEETILKMLQQTIECVAFIRGYCRIGFGGMGCFHYGLMCDVLMLRQDDLWGKRSRTLVT